ncbi:hypothetical protein DICA0_C10572 [Diutina catenulata]
MGDFSLDEDTLKELKLVSCFFAGVLLVLCHYAWVMRQFVVNYTYASEHTLQYWGPFAGTIVLVGVLLVKVAYPLIYKPTVVTKEKKQS